MVMRYERGWGGEAKGGVIAVKICFLSLWLAFVMDTTTTHQNPPPHTTGVHIALLLLLLVVGSPAVVQIMSRPMKHQSLSRVPASNIIMTTVVRSLFGGHALLWCCKPSPPSLRRPKPGTRQY